MMKSSTEESTWGAPLTNEEEGRSGQGVSAVFARKKLWIGALRLLSSSDWRIRHALVALGYPLLGSSARTLSFDKSGWGPRALLLLVMGGACSAPDGDASMEVPSASGGATIEGDAGGERPGPSEDHLGSAEEGTGAGGRRGGEREPGASCERPGETLRRRCGDRCGDQFAICDAVRLIWNEYGECEESAGACLPGSLGKAAPCGDCRERRALCNELCEWEEGRCEFSLSACGTGGGEGSGGATSNGGTGGGSSVSCDSLPVGLSSQEVCGAGVGVLSICDSTPGVRYSVTFTQTHQGIRWGRSADTSGSCSKDASSSASLVWYGWVRVDNPLGLAVRVSLSAPSSGQSYSLGREDEHVTGSLVAYQQIPEDELGWKNCLSGASMEQQPSGTECAQQFACPAGYQRSSRCLAKACNGSTPWDRSVLIPARSGVWVYAGQKRNSDPSATARLDVLIEDESPLVCP